MLAVSNHNPLLQPSLTRVHFSYSALLSQSDVVRLASLELQQPHMRGMANTPVGQLFKSSSVISVHAGVSVLEAFDTMMAEGVQCLAVVDEKSNTLIGNLSASDVQALYRQYFVRILQPVGKFLKQHHIKSLSVTRIKPVDTIGHAVKLMMQHSLHHVWVTDSGDVPVGVITMTDILRVVRNYSDAEKSITRSLVQLPIQLNAHITRAQHLPVESTTASFASAISHSAAAAIQGGPRLRASLGIDDSVSCLSPPCQADADAVWDEDIAIDLDSTHADRYLSVKIFQGEPDPAAAAAAAAASSAAHSDVVNCTDVSGMDLVAQCRIPVEWILHGFGTGNKNINYCHNNLIMHPQGRLDITFSLTHA
jgi:CBS domain-containing protein